MRKRRITGTELEPTVICMGGGPLCIEGDDDAVLPLLDTYYELGGNFVDSANIYGKWLPSGKNVCDLNIGRWLRSRGVRDKMIVTSKGAHPPLSEMTKPRLRPEQVRADLVESLDALDCGAIDLYYLHRDDPTIPVDEVIGYLNDFVAEGIIRYFGASNWNPARIAAAQSYAERTGKCGFSANQLMWSFAVPDMTQVDYPLMESMDGSAMAYHKRVGLAAIGYESQARGYFQKRQQGVVPAKLELLYGCAETEARYQRALALAQKLDVKLSDITLGYLLNQPFASFAIMGGHTPEQLKDSATAADVLLTDEQVRFLEGVE